MVAAPAVIVNELEVAAVSEVGVKVKVRSPEVPVMTRLVKVATPLTAATEVVPDNVPPPDAIDATTLTVELVTVLPAASTMRITGWVASADPLAAPVGWVVIAAAAASPFTYRTITIPLAPFPPTESPPDDQPDPPPPAPVFAVGAAGVDEPTVPAPPFGDAAPPQSPAGPAA